MRKKKSDGDQGRRFYETSSPFETQVGDPAVKPQGFSDLTEHLDLPRRLMTGPNGPAAMQQTHPERFDNPRGFPGLALVTTGNQVAKFPRQEHSINHVAEKEGRLPRTEK